MIGMDIAKRTHYASLTDVRGRLLQKAFPVSQSREGFEAFYQRESVAKLIFMQKICIKKSAS